MTKTIETFLPVFPGFYNTIFEPNEDSEYEYIDQMRGELNLPSLGNSYDVQFDYDTYYKEVCIGCVNYIEDELISLGIVEEIKFQSKSSPKYYNYSNDSINVEVTLDVTKLSEYINARWDYFIEFIEENYTSYDGFMSHFSNYAEDWKVMTTNFYDNLDGHILGSLLQFVCQYEEEITEENMHYSLEVYLQVDNLDYEVNKIKCPECGEWFLNKSIVDKWNKQIEEDRKGIEQFDIPLKLRNFDEWLINNEVNCGCI